MSDARRYAVWPDPRSRSTSLKGSRPSVPHVTNFSGCDLFCMLCLPKPWRVLVCASFAASSPKVQIINIKRSWSPLITSRFVAAEQPWSPSNWLQKLGHNSTTSPEYKSAGREGFDAATDWCVGWSGRVRYWRCHWPSAQAIYIQPQKDIMNIHCDKI